MKVLVVIAWTILLAVVNHVEGNEQGEKLTAKLEDLSTKASDSQLEIDKNYDAAEAIAEPILLKEETQEEVGSSEETEILKATIKDSEGTKVQTEDISSTKTLKEENGNENKPETDADVHPKLVKEGNPSKNNSKIKPTQGKVSSSKTPSDSIVSEINNSSEPAVIKTVSEDVEAFNNSTSSQQESSKHIETQPKNKKLSQEDEHNRPIVVDKGALLAALEAKQAQVKTEVTKDVAPLPNNPSKVSPQSDQGKNLAKAAKIMNEDSSDNSEKVTKGHHKASQRKVKEEKTKVIGQTQDHKKGNKKVLHHLPAKKAMDLSKHKSTEPSSIPLLNKDAKESQAGAEESPRANSQSKEEKILPKINPSAESSKATDTKQEIKKNRNHISASQHKEKVKDATPKRVEGDSLQKVVPVKKKDGVHNIDSPDNNINPQTKMNVSTHTEQPQTEVPPLAKKETHPSKSKRVKESKVPEKDVPSHDIKLSKMKSSSDTKAKVVVTHDSDSEQIKKGSQIEVETPEKDEKPRKNKQVHMDDVVRKSSEGKGVNDFSFENNTMTDINKTNEKDSNSTKPNTFLSITKSEKMTLAQTLHKSHDTLVATVSLTLIISAILLTVVGVYFRKIGFERRKYIGVHLLQGTDEDELPLFNRETYHDDIPDYSSWSSMRR